jgi:hypothetical protein
MITAKFVKKVNSMRGDARLYKLSEEVEYGFREKKFTKYVVVSAIGMAFDTGRSETFIFPADSKGEIIDWGEMNGSQSGVEDHELVLKAAGYEVIAARKHKTVGYFPFVE